jgi:hypothetical protein
MSEVSILFYSLQKTNLTVENRVKNMKIQEINEILTKLNFCTLDGPPEGQECVRGEWL